MILVLGSRDTRVAEYAAKLYLEGYAPILLLSGSGSIHNDNPGRERFVGTTEAEVFAEIAKGVGVPEHVIFIENKSQNTGDNYAFALELLRAKGIAPKTIIAVHKPYAERRTYATGRVHLPPEVELLVSSPPIPIADYPNGANDHDEHWVHAMVGSLQRIKEYPAKGFQIEQNIPDDVWEAYEHLIALGYTKRLIR